MAGDNTILDLDAMMDIEMDKVESLPDYVTPPEGAYILKVADAKTEKYKTKPKDGKAAEESARIRLTYEVLKTIETKDLPVKDGSLFSENFTVTEDGLKFFKKQAMNILNVDNFDGAKFKDVLDGVKGAEFKAKLTIRKSPNPQGGEYENVQVRPVHEAA